MSASSTPEIDYAAPFVWPSDNNKGWADFFRQWDPQVFAVCRYFRLQPVEADDIAQEMRINIRDDYRAKKTFSINAHFAGYLRIGTRWRCQNHTKRNRTTAPLPGDLPERTQTSGVDEFVEFFPDHVHPEDRIKWLLRDLDKEDQSILTLKQVDELTFVEIGQRLGIAPSTAHAKYSKAIAKLQLRIRRAPQ